MTSAPPSHDTRRAEWLGVLAQAPAGELQRLALPWLDGQRFEWLRCPELGLTMVRARIGGGGDRFNLGEATLTRCALRHVAADGSSVAGVGYVLGRDTAHAERVAQLDALLQRPALHAQLSHAVVQPLAAAKAAADGHERAQCAASRVRFFTLQAEAGA